MSVVNIPHEHHVIRYASWTKLRKDENDNVLGILPDALRLREVETSLSTTWIEWFDGPPQNQYLNAVEMIRRTMSVSPRGGMSKANVGNLRELCQTENVSIRIVHEPTDENDAHASIRRLPRDNLDLLELLAAEAFTETILNRDLP
ncbi:MAG: hypothetical protein GC184_11940 [Rhizobiales bacterium]|nr:hypothetical protein [Hyphomicrobiales bacterium]